jgi:hypothetical protein
MQARDPRRSASLAPLAACETLHAARALSTCLNHAHARSALAWPVHASPSSPCRRSRCPQRVSTSAPDCPRPSVLPGPQGAVPQGAQRARCLWPRPRRAPRMPPREGTQQRGWAGPQQPLAPREQRRAAAPLPRPSPAPRPQSQAAETPQRGWADGCRRRPPALCRPGGRVAMPAPPPRLKLLATPRPRWPRGSAARRPLGSSRACRRCWPGRRAGPGCRWQARATARAAALQASRSRALRHRGCRSGAATAPRSPPAGSSAPAPRAHASGTRAGMPRAVRRCGDHHTRATAASTSAEGAACSTVQSCRWPCHPVPPTSAHLLRHAVHGGHERAHVLEAQRAAARHAARRARPVQLQRCRARGRPRGRRRPARRRAAGAA